jgi:hypothetical protein
VLGSFGASLVAPFAGGKYAHLLEPGSHQQPIVEGEPSEGSYFARAGVVPQPRNDLGNRGVGKV